MKGLYKAEASFDIFVDALSCISLPPERDFELFRISKWGQEVELFWLQGRMGFFYTDLPDLDACILLFGLCFNLCYSAVWKWVFMTRVGNVSQGYGGQKNLKVIYE